MTGTEITEGLAERIMDQLAVHATMVQVVVTQGQITQGPAGHPQDPPHSKAGFLAEHQDPVDVAQVVGHVEVDLENKSVKLT